MTWQEFVTRTGVGLTLGFFGWVIAGAIGHPVAWWLCLIAGLLVAFFAQAAIEFLGDILD